MSSKTRLDVLLTERGFAESRQKAQAIIMSGNVFVAGQRVDKPQGNKALHVFHYYSPLLDCVITPVFRDYTVDYSFTPPTLTPFAKYFWMKG